MSGARVEEEAGGCLTTWSRRRGCWWRGPRLWSGQGSAGHWQPGSCGLASGGALAAGLHPLATTHWLEAPLHWTLPQIFINLRFGSTSIQHSDNNVFEWKPFPPHDSCRFMIVKLILIAQEVLWCSGYHICFTRRRSPVRSWAGSQSFAQLCNCPAQSPSHQIIKYTRYT